MVILKTTTQENLFEYELKFDVFANSEVRILEVGASSAEARDAFCAADFTAAKLTEVTGDLRYYGFRMTDML